MLEFLSDYYSLIKSLHIIAAISWMSGLLYLPRLFVNHAMNMHDKKICKIFSAMELKLLKIIINPAMIITWICAILLFFIPNVINLKVDIWFHVKLLAVIFMTIFNFYLIIEYGKFNNGMKIKNYKFYVYINELPAFLMIIIVLMVIMRPF